MAIVKITQREFDELAEKAQQHDRFLAALRQMGVRQFAVTQARDDARPGYDSQPDWTKHGTYQYAWSLGWLKALEELNQQIVLAPKPTTEVRVLQPELPF